MKYGMRAIFVFLGEQMKVGDLVTVAPGHSTVYLIVSMEAHDFTLLPDCVTLLHPFAGRQPMNKEFIKVISESR